MCRHSHKTETAPGAAGSWKVPSARRAFENRPQEGRRGVQTSRVPWKLPRHCMFGGAANQGGRALPEYPFPRSQVSRCRSIARCPGILRNGVIRGRGRRGRAIVASRGALRRPRRSSRQSGQDHRGTLKGVDTSDSSNPRPPRARRSFTSTATPARPASRQIAVFFVNPKSHWRESARQFLSFYLLINNSFFFNVYA
jgi:hypothetical protein